MGTVTFDGRARPTASWASDNNTGWGNFNAGGSTPASEAQNAYQGGLAVNKKITSSTSRVGVDFDPGSNAANMSGDAQLALWFAKVYVADFGDVNTTYGIELGIGSANNAYYEYNAAGSGANNPALSSYPAAGGYLILAINPTISAWYENTIGSPSLTAVDYFHGAVQMINGSAKNENFALDAIDIGRGLYITGASSTFIDFQTFDQDNTSNRFGVVSGNGVAIVCRGLLTIGANTSGPASCTFSDSTTIVQFADGYQGPGDVGVLVDLGNASTTVNIANQLIGLGNATTSDTRPDFTVTGTSGSCTVTGTLANHRNITLTSATTVSGILECSDLTQSASQIEGGATVITTAANNVAVCNDATFGVSTGFNNMTFESGGTATGHAVELTSTATITLTNINFEEYSGTQGSNLTPASGSNNAAIYNNSGGEVIINVSGGNNPSVRNGTGATTIVQNPVDVTVNAVERDGTNEDGVQVLIETAASGNFIYQLSTTSITRSGTTATATTSSAHGLSLNDYVVIRGVTNHGQYNGVHQVTAVGSSTTFSYTISSDPGADATGTISTSYVLLYGSTTSGTITGSVNYVSNQAVKGVARKSSVSPYFKTSPIVGTLTSNGFEATVTMVRDE